MPPRPGDVYANAFCAEVDRCWRFVHDTKGQATHCSDRPTHTGRWHSPAGNGEWWRVWSCADHVEGLTAVRQFGRRRT